jgi:hypothetical protein
MEHPTYEQLLAYLEGTSPIELPNKIAEHLENCPECAAELAGWQRTIQKLEKCEWPKAQPAHTEFPAIVLKWAAVAAVLMMGIGFGLGRLSEPGAAGLKQSIASEVRKQVQDELKADVLAAFAPGDPVGTNSFQQQLHRQLIAAMGANQLSFEKERLLQGLARDLGQKQDDNQRMLLALLYRVRQEHEADYLSLRHDLETAASVADNDLEQNRQQLSQLAATLLAKNQN